MKYFLCNKCGQSILFVEKDESNGGVCVEPAGRRSSGICGGGYTIELVRKDRKKSPVRQEHFTDKLVDLNKRKSRFMVRLGKVKLTPVMIQMKCAQLRDINDDIKFNQKFMTDE